MSIKTILLLGGYGGTGKPIARWLLKTTDVGIAIAGRNIKEAEEFCAELTKKFQGRNISAVFADVSNYASLVSAFKNINLVIDATTAVSYVQNIAKAALETEIDYLDYHFEQKVVSDLEILRPQIEKSGHCFITQAGFHPGLPATFVRYAAAQFDEMKKAIIGMAMNAKIEKPESIYELVDMLADFSIDIFKNGKWRKANYLDYKMIDFGKRFGIKMCYPLQMEEMRALPKMFPLEETGVYVAGFNWFIDYLVMPFAIILSKIKKGLGRHMIAKWLIFGFNNFSKNNRGVAFVLEAEGVKDGKLKKIKILAEHDDAYEFTAISVVACVYQYLKGKITKTGLFMMGHVVDPVYLMKDMEKNGIKIEMQMLPDIVWEYPAPRKGFKGFIDRLVGPGATKAELWIQFAFAISMGLGMLYYGLTATSWNVWQIIVTTYLMFDLCGGIATNATNTAKRWWHRSERMHFKNDFKFLIAHFYMPLLITLAFFPSEWVMFVVSYAYLV